MAEVKGTCLAGYAFIGPSAEGKNDEFCIQTTTIPKEPKAKCGDEDEDCVESQYVPYNWKQASSYCAARQGTLPTAAQWDRAKSASVFTAPTDLWELLVDTYAKRPALVFKGGTPEMNGNNRAQKAVREFLQAMGSGDMITFRCVTDVQVSKK